MERPKVAIVFHRLIKAGLQRYALNLAEAGVVHLVVVVLNTGENAPDPAAEKWFEDLGVRVLYVPELTAGEMQQEFEQQSISVVYSHSVPADLYVARNLAAFKRFGVRTFAIMLQGTWLEASRKGAPSFYEDFRFVMSRADVVVDPNPEQQTAMLETFSGVRDIRDRTREVTYGVAAVPRALRMASRSDLGLPPVPSDTVVFAHISRMIATKGPRISIQFVELLNAHGYKAELLLIGDGHAHDELRSEGVPACVHVVPGMSNPMAARDVFHVGCHPSVFTGEVGPCSVLEHSAMAKMTVATANANTGRYLKGSGLVVPWQERSDRQIARDMFDAVARVCYTPDKRVNAAEIRRRGEAALARQRAHFALSHLVAPYRAGIFD